MRWLKWTGISIAIVVALIIIGRLTMPLWMPYLAKRLEPWIRTEIMNVISIYIKPTVTIERIEYTWPLDVAVNGVTMTAINPSTNLPVKILSVDRAQITLDRIPAMGEALVFRDFHVDSPTIVVDVLEDGTVVGWDDFLKDASGHPDDRRPSDIFSIDTVQVDQFTFEYALEGYDDRMVLDKLDFVVDNKGKNEDQVIDLPQGKGWYVVDTELKREDLFSVELAGGLNIDTLNVAIEHMALVMDITDESVQFFPPQAQDFIQEHDIQGHLDVDATGHFDIDDIDNADVNFKINMNKSHAAFKDFMIDVESASATFRYENDIFSTDDGVVSLFGGTLGFKVMLEAADPDDPRIASPDEEQKQVLAEQARGILPSAAIEKVTEVASNLELTLLLEPQDMKIEEIHRVDEEATKFAGTVNGDFDMNANLGNFKKSMLGSGEISISDGKFGSNPIMRAFAHVLRIALLGLGGNDRARAIFAIEDEQINFSSLSILASPIGVRGSGWVKFDKTMRLSVNAGPLEGFQESTGGLGRIMGAFTDLILKYIVTGTTDDPRIVIAPLGIGS